MGGARKVDGNVVRRFPKSGFERGDPCSKMGGVVKTPFCKVEKFEPLRRLTMDTRTKVQLNNSIKNPNLAITLEVIGCTHVELGTTQL